MWYVSQHCFQILHMLGSYLHCLKCQTGTSCQEDLCLCINSGKFPCNGVCPDYMSDNSNCGSCENIVCVTIMPSYSTHAWILLTLLEVSNWIKLSVRSLCM